MSKKKSNLRVLSELVEESPLPFTKIMLYLADNDLFEKYFEELELRKQYALEPSITEEDFNNMMSGKGRVKKTTDKDKKEK